MPLPLPCCVLSRVCGRWLEAGFLLPGAVAGCFGASEMPEDGRLFLFSPSVTQKPREQRAQAEFILFILQRK